MPDMDLGDVTIHYEEAGQGPLAYVYCHSLGGNSEDFIQEFDFWKKHFGRVVTWDNRGRGKSSQATKYSLPLYASDLARLLDGLGIQKTVAHGFSWGGVLVQQFAIDYPEKCAAVIVDSSSSEVNVAASERWYNGGERARNNQRGEGGREKNRRSSENSPWSSAASTGLSRADRAHYDRTTSRPLCTLGSHEERQCTRF